jgi:hypothetical protein
MSPFGTWLRTGYPERSPSDPAFALSPFGLCFAQALPKGPTLWDSPIWTMSPLPRAHFGRGSSGPLSIFQRAPRIRSRAEGSNRIRGFEARKAALAWPLLKRRLTVQRNPGGGNMMISKKWAGALALAIAISSSGPARATESDARALATSTDGRSARMQLVLSAAVAGLLAALLLQRNSVERRQG